MGNKVKMSGTNCALKPRLMRN